MSGKPLGLQTLVQASREQVFCDLDGEAVILHLKAGMYYGMDAVGTRIWKLIQESCLVQKIVDVMLEEYEVEPKRCQKDIFAVLERLKKEGLIVVLSS